MDTNGKEKLKERQQRSNFCSHFNFLCLTTFPLVFVRELVLCTTTLTKHNLVKWMETIAKLSSNCRVPYCSLKNSTDILPITFVN